MAVTGEAMGLVERPDLVSWSPAGSWTLAGDACSNRFERELYRKESVQYHKGDTSACGTVLPVLSIAGFLMAARGISWRLLFLDCPLWQCL